MAVSPPIREYVPPAPIALPRAGRVARVLRLGRTLGTAGRHLAPAAGRRLLRRPAEGPGIARAVRQTFEDLGATYVKFGQFVASAPGVVGEQVAGEFRGCLDTGPAVPSDVVRAIVQEEIGRPIEAVFSRFDDTPLAAASISVVHRARTLDGHDVAVKVLRPGIERAVATDLGILDPLIRGMAALGFDQAYNLVGYVVGLRAQVAEELDLRNEARSMAEFGRLFEEFGLTLLVVAEVQEQLSGRRVLTMELLDGAAIDDLASVEAYGVDPRPLVRELLRAWILTALRARAFHADIHAGNLLLLRDGRLGMLDWGIVARLDPETHLLLRRLIEASLGIETAWGDIATYMIKVQGAGLHALGLNDEQIGRFIRSMMEPVLTRPLSEVSMASLFVGTDDIMRLATGDDTPRSLIDRLKLMRDTARAYRDAAAQRSFEHPTVRANFLAAKQLVYLERYGRMYIPEEAILGDRAFLEAALAEPEAR